MALLHQFWPEPASLCITLLHNISWNTEMLKQSHPGTVSPQIVDLMALKKIPCCVLSPLGLHGWLQKESDLQHPEAAKSCALKFKVPKWGRTKEHRLEGQKGHRVVCRLRRIYRNICTTDLE